MKWFKRFTDLTIQSIPETARLVVLTGPNGTGKSSVFDAFKMWHHRNGGHQITWDDLYYKKAGETIKDDKDLITVDFHGGSPTDEKARAKAFYVRSAYRNEPDFTTKQIQAMGSAVEGRKVSKLIDNDSVVSENYQRLLYYSLKELHRSAKAGKAAEDSRIALVRNSMSKVFGDLVLADLGDPFSGGTFFFEKDRSLSFHYKNLSSGEKAAFDLILDIIVKQTDYDDTVYAIDEPDAHMHTGFQALLLGELLNLIPPKSQLWIATHSIGMMRKAKVYFFPFLVQPVSQRGSTTR